jgi:hypothetical protein
MLWFLSLIPRLIRGRILSLAIVSEIVSELIYSNTDVRL